MKQSDKDGEFGGVTMPTKPTTGRIRRQDHPMRQPAEGYNSSDDEKTTVASGPNRAAETKRYPEGRVKSEHSY